MKRALALALFACACADPAIDVQFTVPGRYKSAVRSANLRVLEPPTAEPFDCDDLAFSRLASDVVRLSTVLEVSTGAGETVSLGEIDRLSTKLLVADGLDETGETLVSGCAEVGVIEDAITAEILGEPIAVVTAPTKTATAAPGTRTEPVVFTLADRLSQQLGGIVAEYEVTGGDGAGDSGRASSEADGRLVISAQAPARAGPFVLGVRVRWGTPGRVAVPGAVTPAKDVETIPGRVLSTLSGNVGPSGEAGLALLVSTGVSNQVVTYYRSGGQYVRSTSAPVGGAPVMGLLEEFHDGMGTVRDRVIAIDDRDWYEVRSDGTVDRKVIVHGGFARPIAIVSATSCQPGAPARVVVGFDDGTVAAYGANAATLDTHWANRLGPTAPALEPLASGCVDVASVGAVRTYVLSPGSIPLILIAERAPDDIAVGSWIALSSAIGFAAPSKSNVGLLLGTQIDGNDFVLARARGRITGEAPNERYALIDEGTDLVPGELSPLVTRAGYLDSDNRLDVVALFGSSSDGRVIDGFQIWTYLGLEESGRRIAGPMVGSLPDMTRPDLHLLDLDADGAQDVVVVDRPGTGAAQSRIEIYHLRGS